MAKLIYSMITSLDGYAEAAEGDLGTGADDQEVHTFVGDVFRSVGTYLYGRRMYETMVFWETVHTEPDVPQHILQYARDWKAAEKIVYSTTLESVSSAKTRIERTFDPEAVRKLKAESDHDLTVDGPNLAAQAIAAGLVDEYHLFMTTSVVGGGKRFFPDGVRLDLELVEERAFDSGLIYTALPDPLSVIPEAAGCSPEDNATAAGPGTLGPCGTSTDEPPSEPTTFRNGHHWAPAVRQRAVAGGQQHLPADGPQALPGDGHVITRCARRAVDVTVRLVGRSALLRS